MHEKRFEGEIARLRAPERVERLEVKRVVGLCLEKSRAKHVLDVGTGSGLFAEEFAKHGLRISGVDANPEMLPVAREFVPEGDFRLGTVESLPWPDTSFDLVFLGLVLHEADDILQALKETRRVTGSQVCILEWPYRDGTFGPPLAHRLDPKYLYTMFEEVGFRKWDTTELTNTMLYRLEV